jgi:L-asparagine oxygenase
MKTIARNATPPAELLAHGLPFALGPIPETPMGSTDFLRRAGYARRLLPMEVHTALIDFADESHDSGALLFRGLPVGPLPATPERPTARIEKDMWTEFLLLTIGRSLGQPVGYLPEHGGDVVQNIVPTPTNATRQTSTSSKVELLFHTETAFHPHRPRYLLLLCLRGDPSAKTTLASIHDAMELLDPGTISVLRQPRFRTATDESFRTLPRTSAAPLGSAMSVISGAQDSPTLVFDADLMVGIDDGASEALDRLSSALQQCHGGVVLEPGDLLIVDNYRAVHGRTPFAARFDGTDRWLQRSFVVSDLAPSAQDRLGRIIATAFD